MLFNVIQNISICCVFLGISFPLGYREGPDRSLSQTERHSFPAVTNTYKLDAHNDKDCDNDNDNDDDNDNDNDNLCLFHLETIEGSHKHKNDF